MTSIPDTEIRDALDCAPEPAAWERFLARMDSAGPFHLPAWRAALRLAHPHLRDRTLWLSDGQNIRAALPVLARRRLGVTRASSQPYGTAGGAWLANPSDMEAARALVAAFARRFARPWNDCVMADHGGQDMAQVLRQHWPGASCRSEHTHRLDLPGTAEELERGYPRRTRKALRHAAGLGLRVEAAVGESGLAEFMAFQHRERAQRGTRLSYPTALLRAGLEEGWLTLHRLRRGGDTLAVTAVAEARGQWFAWLVAHSPSARDAPTGEVLFDALLKAALARGVTRADFGSSSGRQGPAFFKEGFGAREVEYRVWRSGPLARGGH